MPSSSENKPGTLFVVGTPIGNLGDITLRAIDVLRSVDRVAAEDTRHTRNLLTHLGISGKPIDCIESHVSMSRLLGVVRHLEAGSSVALVTDAGMPAVSDPGAQLVEEAHKLGLAVVVIPGPSAVTMAIAASGLVEGPFFFFGFLPRQGGRRRRALERIVSRTEAVVLFEAPTRIRDTLTELGAIQPERPAAVCRELTKLHEEIRRGTLGELARSDTTAKGGIVLVLGPYQSAHDLDATSELPSDPELLEELATGCSVRELLDRSKLSGKERRAFYQRLLHLRDSLPEVPP